MQQMWQPPITESAGLFGLLNQQVADLELRHPYLLPDLRRGRTMFVTSDYAGDKSPYHITSLLFTDNVQVVQWEGLRQVIRRDLIRDSRTMAFKSLGDKVRQRVLPEFLRAANEIAGLSITIAVDRQAPVRLSEQRGFGKENYAHWKPDVWERMLWAVSMISFFVAGLSAEGQHLLWISDNDAIAANKSYKEELTGIFKHVSSLFLPHKMGEFQFVTTSDDPESQGRQFEDYASVPDLVAGALCELMTANHRHGTPLVERVMTPLPAVSAKAESIMWWFAENRRPLKRLVLLIQPSAVPDRARASFVDFSRAFRPAII